MPSHDAHGSKFFIVDSDKGDKLTGQAPRNEPNNSAPTAPDAPGSSTAAQSSAQSSAEGDTVPAPVDAEGLWCEPCFFGGILSEGDMPSCETSKGCAACDKAKIKCREMEGEMVPIARELLVACSDSKDAATPELQAKAQEKQRELRLKAIVKLCKKIIMDNVNLWNELVIILQI
ncbi:hypothetical protein FPRO04_13268 [Fusarium proliferatum]|nr:hypothetical protein FPRO04_13268 [Fusarium proliferatum]